jgi:TonB family protein
MNWLYYLAEANLYLGVFYLAYCLFLTKETYYQLTRAYLLFACVASFILPVLQIGALKPVEAAVVTTVAYTLPEYTAPQEYAPIETRPPIVAEQHFTVDDYLMYAYFVGAGIVFLMLMLKLFTLFRLIAKTNRIVHDEHKLVYLPQTNVAFSFFNYLFIGAEAQGTNTIIRHELVHIRQKHSVDIVFVELLKVVSWFNPFIYLLQNSLKTVHEYIADEQTAAYETDALTYSSFLVNNAYGAGSSSITHSFFNYNLLKKRIVMLNKKRSGNLARFKYLVAVPVCAGLLCVSTLAFSKTYGWVDIDPAVPVNVEAPPLPIVNNDVPPLPTIASDGYEKLITYLSKNMRYHDALIKATNVVIVINFNVNANHKIADAKISRSGGSAFDALAMVALKSYKGKVNAKPGNRNIVFDFYANNTTPEEMAIVNGNPDKRAGLVVILPNRQGGPAPVKFPPPVVKPETTGPVKFPPPVVKPDAKTTVKNPDIINKDDFKAFYAYLTNNIKYPAADRDKGINGCVTVEFNVDNDKHITYIKMIKSPNDNFSQEIIRVLKSAPNLKLFAGGAWTLPVSFNLNGYTLPTSYLPLSNIVYNPNGFNVPDYTPTQRLPEVVIKGFTKAEVIKDPVTTGYGTKTDWEKVSSYLANNVRYPAVDRENGIAGRVYTVFAVDANNKLMYAKVVKTPSKSLGNEVMRALRSYTGSTPFKPGQQYTLTIEFSLNSIDNTAVTTAAKNEDALNSYNPNNINIAFHDTDPQLRPIIIRGYMKMPAQTGADVAQPDWQKIVKYFANTIKYPVTERQETIGGRVITLFSVDADQKLQYAKVVRTPSAALGDEVIKALQKCTEFAGLKPGVQYVLPVSFTLGYADPNNSVEVPLKSRSNGLPNTYNPNAIYIPINAPGSLSLNDVVIRGYVKKL